MGVSVNAISTGGDSDTALTGRLSGGIVLPRLEPDSERLLHARMASSQCSVTVAPQALRLHHHLSPAFAVQFLVCLGALVLGWRVVTHYKGRTVSAPSAKGATQEGLDRLPAAAARSRSKLPTPGVHYAHTVPGN